MEFEDREIYPNAPLSLVAFELRFSPVPRLESDAWESVFEQLRDDFPILGPRPHREVELTPAGPVETLTGRRFMARTRSKAVIVGEDVVTLETSAYRRFEEFCADIKAVLTAVDEAVQIPSIQRVGLRYIDEIAIPDMQDSSPEDWKQYIEPGLLSPTEVSGFGIDQYFVRMRLRAKPEARVNCRLGLMDDPVVNPSGPLHIRKTPEGRFFLIDLDSFWEAPREEFPEYATDAVLERVGELHRPIRTIFESSITDALREVMREEQA